MPCSFRLFMQYAHAYPNLSPRMTSWEMDNSGLIFYFLFIYLFFLGGGRGCPYKLTICFAFLKMMIILSEVKEECSNDKSAKMNPNLVVSSCKIYQTVSVHCIWNFASQYLYLLLSHLVCGNLIKNSDWILNLSVLPSDNEVFQYSTQCSIYQHIDFKHNLCFYW